jgi:hypothetical protein
LSSRNDAENPGLKMRIISILFLCVAVAMGAFGYWGCFTVAGQVRYDEMDSLIPAISLVGSFVAALLSALIWMAAHQMRTRAKLPAMLGDQSPLPSAPLGYARPGMGRPPRNWIPILMPFIVATAVVFLLVIAVFILLTMSRSSPPPPASPRSAPVF